MKPDRRTVSTKTATTVILGSYFHCISRVYLSLIIVVVVVSLQRRVRRPSCSFLCTAADSDQIGVKSVVAQALAVRVAAPLWSEFGLHWPWLQASCFHQPPPHNSLLSSMKRKYLLAFFFSLFYVSAAAASLYSRGKYSTSPRLECVLSEPLLLA